MRKTGIVLSFLILPNLLALPGLSATAGGEPTPPQERHSAYLDHAKTEKVKWFTSPDSALKRARELNRPVLLDVGATWCPWCDLMQRESYEDPSTADYINEHFVPLKIDFDADPNLSAELERVQAVANLPAGLPLTAFLTPDGKLYSGGGFFPKEATADKPAFRDALAEAVKMFAGNRSEIEKEAVKIKFGGER